VGCAVFTALLEAGFLFVRRGYEVSWTLGNNFNPTMLDALLGVISKQGTSLPGKNVASARARTIAVAGYPLLGGRRGCQTRSAPRHRHLAAASRRHGPIARRTSARASSQAALSLARSASRARVKAATAVSIGIHTSTSLS
jgi:hypothetical protein